MNYQLRRQPNGSFSLFHAGLGETMHPQLGPSEEARRLYVEGTGLEALLTSGGREGGEVVVFDVGLGGAANAVAALQKVAELRRRGRAVRPLRVVSFERDLDAPRFALQHAAELSYLDGHEAVLRSLLDAGEWEEGGLAWELRAGEFTRLIEDEPRRSDAVFFDPYSARNNAEMWSVRVLEAVYRCRRPGRPMTLATYSSAFGVRASLMLAGFYVGDGPTLSGKRPSTLAATDFAFLRQPLDRVWLARWRHAPEPWPPFTPKEAHRGLREGLLSHPQWSHFEGGATDDEDGPAPPRRRKRRDR